MSPSLSELTPGFRPKYDRPKFITDPSNSTAYSIGWNNKMAYMSPIYEPLPTMYLNETLPEKSTHQQHHLPFPWWRNKVTHWVHNPDGGIHIPSADVRETLSHYFIDVELPGLKDKSKLSLRWTSTRSLLVQASIERPHLPDCQNAGPAEAEKTTETKAQAGTQAHGTANGTVNGTANGTHSKCETCAGDPSANAPEPCSCSGDIKQQVKEAHAAATQSSNTTNSDTTDSDTHPTTFTESSDSPKERQTHIVSSERHIGYVARNFNFPIDVEYEKMGAKLDAGLLTLMVEKKKEHRVVEAMGDVVVH